MKSREVWGRRGRWLRVGGAALAFGIVITANGCLRTGIIASGFNGGALDSPPGDARHPRSQFEQETALRAVREDLVDAYFGQGAGAAHPVSQWLRAAAGSTSRIMDAARSYASGVPEDVPLLAREWCDGDTPLEPVCPAGGARRDDVARTLLDQARFEASMDRVVTTLGTLLRLRYFRPAELETGLQMALLQAAAYEDDRPWHRDLSRPVVGIVAKGGAVSGLYAAGVVWIALRIVEECRKSVWCSQAHPDLTPQLASGTSTGALIATAVDYFATSAAALKADLVANPVAATKPAKCTPVSGNVDALQGTDRFAAWFTCNAIQDLYCVRDASLFDLLRNQRGVDEFLGIQAQMRHQLRGCATFNNGTELVLSTVDFRTGRLYTLSDVDRCGMRSVEDLVQGATASAVLPIIAKPVDHLPVDYDTDAGKPVFSYLDGGIRAELPVLPLAHRGAERVLVVSSSGPVAAETDGLRSALSIGPRYIGIETDAAAEVELQRAQEHAERVRGAEIEVCRRWVRDAQGLVPGAGPIDLEAICTGRVAAACGGSSAAKVGAARVAGLWRMTTLFRDEDRVPGSPGYQFDPAAQRALFLAGTEAARARCIDVATTLGLDEIVDAVDPAVAPKRADVVGWCASPMLPTAKLCGTEVRTPKLETCPDASTEAACEPLMIPQLTKCRAECVRW